MALAISAGCGGGEDSSSSTPTTAVAEQARQAQAQANAEVKARNEEVRKTYTERKQATAPAAEETEAKQSAVEAYRGLGAVSRLRYLKPDFNVRAGLERAQGDETLHGLCEFMSSEAQEQTIEYAKQASGIGGVEWTCETATALLARRANVANDGKGLGAVKVLGVNAQGDKATASIQVGNAPATSVPLVREDGEWKLAANQVR